MMNQHRVPAVDVAQAPLVQPQAEVDIVEGDRKRIIESSNVGGAQKQ